MYHLFIVTCECYCTACGSIVCTLVLKRFVLCPSPSVTIQSISVVVMFSIFVLLFYVVAIYFVSFVICTVSPYVCTVLGSCEQV